MKRAMVLACMLLFVSITVFAATPKPLTPRPVEPVKDKELKAKLATLRIPFIKNESQLDSSVRYYANIFSGTVFITDEGLTYALNGDDKADQKGWVIREKLLQAKTTKAEGKKVSGTKVNYFRGKYSSKWRSNIATYQEVSLGEVYDHIRLHLRAYGNNMEKVFTVEQGGNPEAIAIKVEGAKGLKVNEQGELEIETGLGTVKMTKPVASQKIGDKRIEVVANYTLRDSELIYGFKVGNYNKNYPLIVDPLLASTFIGGSDKEGADIIIDSEENVFISGWTYSSNYPITPGAYDEIYDGWGDGFVSKLNSDLSALLASTFIGGSDNEDASAITIDSSNNIIIAGWTYSADYPTTTGAYDESYNSSRDAFVSKLNNDLTTLLASTFIGGPLGYSSPSALASDSSNNVFVAGEADSTHPTTPGAYDESFNGASDVFISKLNGDLTTLLASTFIGGSNGDIASDLAIDLANEVLIVGRTFSSDYPTTAGAYDTSYSGGMRDGFVSILNNNLTTLLASTFIGGSDDDSATALTIDPASNILIAGWTTSSNFPTKVGAYDQTYNGSKDVFVSQLNHDLTTLLASTFIGGNDNDFATDIAIGAINNVFIAGKTFSSDYPITIGAYDESLNGRYDAFISKLRSDFSIILASTFIGKIHPYYSIGLAIDSSNNIFISGTTVSSDYPTTSGAYNESFNGDYDAFVSKLTPDLSADSDNDSTPDIDDNCPLTPNGPILGTCTINSPKNAGSTCTNDSDCDTCTASGTCSMDQEDTDSDGIGDVCDVFPDDPCGPSEQTPEGWACGGQWHPAGCCSGKCGLYSASYFTFWCIDDASDIGPGACDWAGGVYVYNGFTNGIDICCNGERVPAAECN